MTDKKKPILNIFDVLGKIDMGDKTFYDSLTEEEQKGFIAYVVMRWLSSVQDKSGYSSYYVLMVNEILNVNFWELSKHNGLIYKLMASIGVGKKLRHEWIAPSKKANTKHFTDFLYKCYPNMNKDEYNAIMAHLTADKIKERASDMAIPDDEIKKIISDYKLLS